MTNLEKLLARGAECCGGDLIFKHKTLGRFRDGDLILTEDGLAELEVDEVVVKAVAPRPVAKKAAKKDAEKAVEVAPAAPTTPVDDNGELEVEID